MFSTGVRLPPTCTFNPISISNDLIYYHYRGLLISRYFLCPFATTVDYKTKNTVVVVNCQVPTQYLNVATEKRKSLQ